MKRVRVGVVGVGHLGRHHARLLSENERAELVAVADSDAAARKRVGEDCGVDAVADYRELAGRVDAVCIAVPTSLHREVATYFLERDADVLVEKPIAPNVEDGRAIADLAAERGRILQVGHVERFNPALSALPGLGFEPRYIESQRLGSFSFRSTDIGVVLDLMIHDLDLVLALVGAPVKEVHAFGGAVFTPAEDMATAIVEFENGAVAQLTASRVALKPMRRMRLFSKQGYVSLDYQTAQGIVIRKNPGWDLQKLDLDAVDPSSIDDLWQYVFDGLLSVDQFQLDEGNPLADEIDAFLGCVIDRSRPLVSGDEGCAAVALAARIQSAIRARRW